MWKRDQNIRPANNQPAPPVPLSVPAPVARSEEERPERPPLGPVVTAPVAAPSAAVPIGKSVVVKGELSASEDLTVEGSVEGKINLRESVLTIGRHGRVKGETYAKAVIVLGNVTGNITASEKVDIRDGGSVDGDVVAPRVAIAEGAHFRGSVDMQTKPAGNTRADRDSAPLGSVVDTRASDGTQPELAH